MTIWHEYHQYALENGGMDEEGMPDGDRSGEGEVGPEDPEREPFVFTHCNVCGRKLHDPEEDQMGMCAGCANL